jgi:hypothetical protein
MFLRLEKNAVKDPYAILSATEIRGLIAEAGAARIANWSRVSFCWTAPKHGRVAPDPRPFTP